MKIRCLKIKQLSASLARAYFSRAVVVCSLYVAALLFVTFPEPAAAMSQLSAPEAVSVQVDQRKANKAIALRFATEGWGTNATWQQAWDELVADDIVYHFNSSAEPVVGLENNKAFNAELFDGFPDLHQTIETVVAEGDEVIYRSTLSGTHTGDFLGIAATGKPVKITDFTQLRIADGKVAEWWYECNLLEVMNQLGLATL